MRALLISNPTASRVTDARRRVVVRALASVFDLEVAPTGEPGHAAHLAREAAASGFKAVVVYGGDGTVNEAVNGLLGEAASTDVLLGILPGGGTNVLARTLGYPEDLLEATDHLLGLVERGQTRRLNLGRAVAELADSTRIERAFTFAAGLGLDADTVRRADATGLRARLGDLLFVYCGFRAFLAIHRTARRGGRPPLTIRAGGHEEAAWWAIICQSDPLTYLGSRPLRVCPGASHDRRLTLTAARTARFWRTLRWLPQALRDGRHVRHPDVLHLPDLPELTIDADPSSPLQTDGEYLGEARRLSAISLPEALAVFS